MNTVLLALVLACGPAGDGERSSAKETTPSDSTPETQSPSTSPTTPTTSSSGTTASTDSTSSDPGGATTSTELGTPATTLQISEVCAWNRGGPGDPDGRRRDWIELHNPGSAAVSLSGLTLTDDLDQPDKHALAAELEVPAGGHLVLWADGDPERGPHHLDFKLDSDGEPVALFFDGALVDVVDAGSLPPDHSLARTAEADWRVSRGSPGAAEPAVGQSGPPGRTDCAPVVTAAEAYLVEGDTVVFTVACEGPDALQDLDVRLLGVPDPHTFDPVTGRLEWTTGLADGGRYDVVVEVKPPDEPAKPETAWATVWVADAIDDPLNVAPFPSRYQEEWGVPVLHVEHEGALSESYIPMVTHLYGVPWSGTIKKRGAASLWYPKNNYTLEFEPDQIDMSELGLRRKDHLVLISNFDDNSHARQKLTYDTWAAMADFSGDPRLTPSTAYVVVYLDGAYSGLYVAIDHIDDEFVREQGLDPASNLYKSVNHDANFRRTNAGGWEKWTLHDGWEKKEGLPIDDYSDLEALTAFVADASPYDFEAGAAAWLDVEEYMDWFLLVHHLAADDSAGKNAYLVNDGGLFRYVPWDFNHALGQDWQTLRVDAWAYNDFRWNNQIFAHLQDHPVLSMALWARYAELRAPGGPLSAEAMVAALEDYDAVIQRSAQRDWTHWEEDYRSYGGWSWRSDFLSAAEERAYLEDWIVERATWADETHP